MNDVLGLVGIACFFAGVIVGIIGSAFVWRKKLAEIHNELCESITGEDILFTHCAQMKKQIEQLEKTRVVINIPDGDPDAVVIDR